MRIQFLGGTGTVTGSKYLISESGKNILVDCGVFQGSRDLKQKNWDKFLIDPKQIDAIVLTHAHIDHSGYIPKLAKDGFRGPIYCTPPTASLCRILLLDSAKIMEEEARYANKKRYSKHSPALPLFTVDEANEALEQLHPIQVHTEHEILPGLRINFKRTGHIIGAASVRLFTDKKSVTFSGDVGRINDPVMVAPEPLDPTDYLVLESTYGDRQHPATNVELDLQEVLRRTSDNGGSVLIPAFAVGRAQQILYYISKLKAAGKMPNMPVYLDSPMAVNATGIYCEFRPDHRLSESDCQHMCNGATYLRDVEDSKRIQADTTSKIVISASGMATGGRVLHYLKKLLPDSKNAILFAGFQAAGTRGAALVQGVDEIKIHGEKIAVRAKIENMENLSAHADAGELVTWLEMTSLKPQKVFVTHGEPTGSEALKKKIEARFGWQTIVPKESESFEL